MRQTDTVHDEPDDVGQCEAQTKRGRRCVRPGSYDGYHGIVLCGIHLDELERALVATRGHDAIPIYAGQSIEERL